MHLRRTSFNLALLALLALATLAGLILIPNGAMVPVRWGLDLQPTATLPKFQGLLQMPIGTAAVWAIVWAIRRYGNSGRHVGQARALDLVPTVVTAVFTLIQVVIVVSAR